MHIVRTDRHKRQATDEALFFEGNPFVTEEIPASCSVRRALTPTATTPSTAGEESERGAGPGVGLNRNWPLPQGTEDGAYLAALDAALDAALAAVGEFAPRYLVVCVGLDIVAGDPVAGFRVTTKGLRETGGRIAGLGHPTVLVQEGGYLLEQLGENTVALLRASA